MNLVVEEAIQLLEQELPSPEDMEVYGSGGWSISVTGRTVGQVDPTHVDTITLLKGERKIVLTEFQGVISVTVLGGVPEPPKAAFYALPFAGGGPEKEELDTWLSSVGAPTMDGIYDEIRQGEDPDFRELEYGDEEWFREMVEQDHPSPEDMETSAMGGEVGVKHDWVVIGWYEEMAEEPAGTIEYYMDPDEDMIGAAEDLGDPVIYGRTVVQMFSEGALARFQPMSGAERVKQIWFLDMGDRMHPAEMKIMKSLCTLYDVKLKVGHESLD